MSNHWQDVDEQEPAVIEQCPMTNSYFQWLYSKVIHYWRQVFSSPGPFV